VPQEFLQKQNTASVGSIPNEQVQIIRVEIVQIKGLADTLACPSGPKRMVGNHNKGASGQNPGSILRGYVEVNVEQIQRSCEESLGVEDG
jgi:hypothetical protein